MKKIKLFCLPYAGGSATIYEKWRKYLNPQIDLYPIELSGRGKRFTQPFYHSWDEAIHDTADQIKTHMDGSPVALFGYSMGSTFALDLAYKIKDWTDVGPQYIFFAARAAPHKQKNERIHHLPDDLFLNEVLKKGGTPKQILESQEMLDIFLPILRSDFRIIESYNNGNKSSKLSCDISVLGGTKDTIYDEDLLAWGDYTSGRTSLHKWEGGHFFIHDHTLSMIHLINEKLNSIQMVTFKF